MFPFRVIEHVIPCQHVRGYARAVADEQDTVLHLHVKQYLPLDNPNPQPGDVTIVGGHANGFPKERYEPLWEDMLARSKKHNFRIRSIWIADVAHQGHSGILNEELLGNDPNWLDHPRDLLHMINMKRDQMPRPIIGIGHSMGGHNLVNLAYMHPRLLTTLVLIDPVIQIWACAPPNATSDPVQLSTFRRDIWPSRDAAAKSFQSNEFYQNWDERVLNLWIQHGLRDMPTRIHPVCPDTRGPKQVTLTTTKHQEVFTFVRPNFEGDGVNGKPIDRSQRPDLNPSVATTYPFYRGEGPMTYFRLPELRPSVLYVFGATSDASHPDAREAKLKTTGAGVGGSGGAAEGRVQSVVFDGVGHLVAMEAPGQTADPTSEWIGKEMERWRAEEEEHERMWRQKSTLEKQVVDEEWKQMVGGPPGRLGAQKPKL